MKIIKNLIIGILAFLGVVFLILLILPEEEEKPLHSHVSSASSGTSSALSPESPGEQTEGAQELSTAAVRPIATKTTAKSATVLIYMNGSDLESSSGEATEDLGEMLDSGIGKNVNVIVQTMGTRRWQEYGISSRTAQRYRINKGQLELIQDKLGQLNCTVTDTLSDFIEFGKSNYPADRYIFIFWNHGGGPVYGFGYDEWQNEEDALTLDEMYEAFSRHKDIRFDLIGMDCCIMGSLETCCAFSSFCDYTALSEDFESGLGWSYTGWMKELEADPAISTPVLGKSIIDQMIKANEEDYGGDTSTMALVDEATVARLYLAWTNFAYDNEEELLGSNYSKKHRAKGRSFWDFWDADGSDVTL
ncbi:MAG: hypothetical protein K6E30_11215, partial [Lachnospiraceae bacterium]|nr:hypothetical protein [Lachnospiraceae bacterium]